MTRNSTSKCVCTNQFTYAAKQYRILLVQYRPMLKTKVVHEKVNQPKGSMHHFCVKYLYLFVLKKKVYYNTSAIFTQTFAP